MYQTEHSFSYLKYFQKKVNIGKLVCLIIHKIFRPVGKICQRVSLCNFLREGKYNSFFFACDMRKQSRDAPCGRRGGKLMEKRELVSTGMYTEKQAALNMERCAEFMARMIQKYGAEILKELDEEKTQGSAEKTS